ncbi:alpha/beta hydrolase [Cellulomonas sp.]|uniref:alpha/beta hydrolase n=1 Tax=Cellulomonas sp. TaxID=40001 RepID=UPI003BAA98CA
MDDSSDGDLPADVLVELGTGGDWLSSWWTVVALLALAALGVLWAVRRRARHRFSWPLWTVSVLAVVLAAGFVANIVVGYVPNVAAARTALASRGYGPAPVTPATAHTGRVESVHIPAPDADRMPADSLTWVYTPPGYPDGSARYPVVYLVHGTPGVSGDWFAGGDVPHAMDVLLARGLVQPMIVVSLDVNGTGPGATDTECLDSTTGGSRVETYLTSTAIAWVDREYRTAADWQHRTIGGFSAGGFCALDQGLRHSELYGTILGIEPYGDPGAGGRAMLATDAEWDEHDVVSYASTIPLPHDVALFVDIAGREHDQPRRDGTAIAEDLAARGQDVLEREEAGHWHTWTMARVAIPYGLEFASARMP